MHSSSYPAVLFGIVFGMLGHAARVSAFQGASLICRPLSRLPLLGVGRRTVRAAGVIQASANYGSRGRREVGLCATERVGNSIGQLNGMRCDRGSRGETRTTSSLDGAAGPSTRRPLPRASGSGQAPSM